MPLEVHTREDVYAGNLRSANFAGPLGRIWMLQISSFLTIEPKTADPTRPLALMRMKCVPMICLGQKDLR